ncbi:MAG: hypothetical protein PHC85_02300 [Candidatus Pacebacteria bacterium]|nr:hypothetical protein [Candidatus Paceibacterota bacterium]
MDELKQLLQRNLEVSEESLNILKKMHHSQQIGRVLRFLKWTLIIIISLGAYYYIQPFVSTFWDTFVKIQSDISALSGTGETQPKSEPSDLIQNIQKLFGRQVENN